MEYGHDHTALAQCFLTPLMCTTGWAGAAEVSKLAGPAHSRAGVWYLMTCAHPPVAITIEPVMSVLCVDCHAGIFETPSMSLTIITSEVHLSSAVAPLSSSGTPLQQWHLSLAVRGAAHTIGRGWCTGSTQDHTMQAMPDNP
eukprot:CAMPEP_0174703180 /NCGR_PEP_ID=MMETSP1094-20130205/7220_1 /TAXON_ID=156173 /ORGANISM="Chrysochromulina brevifilum, Strain UTEX LB 985" /LENGTH=141 /DNA_ID=CAMNT_0015901063 /DNA_START=66 /DNA_END=491 /DNA_ORIENTATION=-